jgi:hypothetical protein
MRFVRRVAVGLVVVLATTLFVTVQPASADGLVYSTTENARTEFKSYGDAIVVCDVKGGGRGAYGGLWYYRSNGELDFVGSAWDRDGANNGSCGSFAGREEVPEGRLVLYSACDVIDGVVQYSTCVEVTGYA